jgi:Tfp pilus assembly protein PilF
MTQRLALGAALLSLLFAASCCSPPDMKQKKPEGPQFDADFYSKNAKEYIDQGHYGQAKDQWQKQLIKDPGNWMAQMGIAYCDLYLSEEAVAARNLEEARTRVKAAEKGFREIRTGPIEADTAKEDPKRPQWKAELGLAMSIRTLGYLDQRESQRNLELAKRGGPDASKAADKAAELQIERDRNYQDAISRFQSLAYMQHASPEAIKNLGDLYVVTKQDALAEQEFRRYLEIAQVSHAKWEEDKKKAAEQYGPTGVDIANQLFDQKLASNTKKQVSVMMDLAQLSWARQDYMEARRLVQDAIKIQPDNKDLYLRLGEAEAKLDMLETAIINLDEYLRRTSQKREEFSDDVRHAMKLKAELQQKLKERGGK